LICDCDQLHPATVCVPMRSKQRRKTLGGRRSVVAVVGLPRAG
jgi:hypothetical protein